MTSFRRRTQHTTAAAAQRKSRGPRAFFSDRLSLPSVSDKTDGIPVLILDAKYPSPISDNEGLFDSELPYYLFMQAKVALVTGKDTFNIRTDSVPNHWPKADGQSADDPRLYVDRTNRPANVWRYLDEIGDKRISFAKRYAWNVIDLRPHHELEKQTAEGKTVTFQKGPRAGDAIMERVPCEGAGCAQCADNIPLISGRKGYLELGANHNENLMSLEVLVEDNCRACRTGDIKRTAFICPECNDEMLDLTTAKLKAEEVESLYAGGMKCPSCKTPNVLPIEEITCSKCKSPSRATAADVVWFLRKTGKDKASAVGVFKKNTYGWCWPEEFQLADEVPLVLGITSTKTQDGAVDLQYDWHPDIEPLLSAYDFNQVKGVGLAGLAPEKLADFLHIDLPNELRTASTEPAPDKTGASRRPSGQADPRRRTGSGSRY